MTEVKDFTTSFVVDAGPDVVFAAICKPRAWWSGAHEGVPGKLGDVFAYRYHDMHYSRQEVTEFVPGKRVVWLVLESQLNFIEDKNEWTGTSITFDIESRAGKTEVRFTHVGLKPAVECYDTCSDAWTALIQGSLREYIETGKTDMLELDAL